MTHRIVAPKNDTVAPIPVPSRVPGFRSIDEEALTFDDVCPNKPARRNSTRKRVRFQVDEEGRTHWMDAAPSSSDDPGNCSDCFYSPDEQVQMKSAALMAASELTVAHFGLVLAMESVLGSPVSLSRSRHLELNGEVATRLLPELLVQRGARGLELLLSEVLRQHQRWATKSTLDLQTTLRKANNPDMSDELRIWCEHVNQATKEFALTLARLDEDDARRIQSTMQ